MLKTTSRAAAARRCLNPRPRLARRCLSSVTGSGDTRDAWDDPGFAKNWSLGGGVERTNPDRAHQLHLLGCLVADRCSAHMRDGGDARVLDLGIGSGLAARSILEAMPKRASIVGVDSSPAMLEILREGGAPDERLKALPIGFEDLDSSREALGIAGAGGAGRRFACAVAVQSLHEVNDATKRQALGFACTALAPEGTLYILDRFNIDLGSPLTDDYAALWRALHKGGTEHGRPALGRGVEGWRWDEYASYMASKLDDAWESPQARPRHLGVVALRRPGASLPTPHAQASRPTTQACVRLCREMGLDAECLYVAFNRFLVAARPRAGAENEAAA